jgi:hypothetical protein
MYFQVTRTLITLVILLISLEILGPSATASPSTSDHTATLHSQKAASSMFGSFLFEKTEEETERNEDEKDRMARIVLVNFSRIAFSLSFYHTPPVNLTVLPFQYDVRPPLHELNCVFLI